MHDILVQNLTKRFDKTIALQQFNAAFPAGTVTCIMGPSGCGKTTLLNILMGFLTPDEGEILGLPERISAVFQEDRLLEGFSPLDNLRFVCPKISSAVMEEHLTAVGLAEAIRQPVRELSGGMKRRVAIVRAVLAARELLILDEPFKGLDEDTRAVVTAYLRQHTAGVTVIMVTHDEEEVALVGGSLIRMEPAVR